MRDLRNEGSSPSIREGLLVNHITMRELSNKSQLPIPGTRMKGT